MTQGSQEDIGTFGSVDTSKENWSSQCLHYKLQIKIGDIEKEISLHLRRSCQRFQTSKSLKVKELRLTYKTTFWMIWIWTINHFFFQNMKTKFVMTHFWIIEIKATIIYRWHFGAPRKSHWRLTFCGPFKNEQRPRLRLNQSLVGCIWNWKSGNSV